MEKMVHPAVQKQFSVSRLAALENRRYCSSRIGQRGWGKDEAEIFGQDDCVDTCRLAYIRSTRRRRRGIAGGKQGRHSFLSVFTEKPERPVHEGLHAYVAAGGHSAYATTPYARIRSLYIICGSGLNAPSQKVAEDRAMKSCEAARSHYKVITGAGCEVAASK